LEVILLEDKIKCRCVCGNSLIVLYFLFLCKRERIHRNKKRGRKDWEGKIIKGKRRKHT
jgi:hypothetical protein